LTNLAVGLYTVTITDANGCTASVSETIIDATVKPTVDLGVDVRIDLGETIQLNAQTGNLNTVNYVWTPTDNLSCTDCPKPIAKPINTTTYTVVITDANGCTATDSIRIAIKKDREVFIPNAFTPNDDLLNDGFTVYAGTDVKEIASMDIFDRWGNHVFRKNNFAPNDPSLGWDGTFKGMSVRQNVFVYYIEIEFTDGKKVLFKGDITVVK
jgi:gliding motility-associated-like protein